MALLTHFIRSFAIIVLSSRSRLATTAALTTTTTTTTALAGTAAFAALAALAALTTTAALATLTLAVLLFAGGAGGSGLLSRCGSRLGVLRGPFRTDQFGNRLAAPLSLFLRRTQLSQRLHGRLHGVGRVGAAQRLGQNITNAHGLHYGAHCSARDYTRTGRGRFEHHFRGSETGLDHKRNGSAGQRHVYQVF